MKSLFPLSLISLILVFIGCSGGNPTQPKADGTNPISISTRSTSNAFYPGVFGAWQIYLDAKTMSAEIVQSRNSQKIGDIFDADLSQFLTVSPCADCLAITKVSFDRDLNLCVDFLIRHPFKNLASRPDLHGFDVRLIFILPAETGNMPQIKVMKPDGTEEPAKLNLVGLLNPDGWTSHYDNIVTNENYFIGGSDVPGNLNPFLRYFDDCRDIPFDPFNPAGHNVMAVGSGHQTRTAIFPSKRVDDGIYLYAVADVAYGQSATLANRQNPQYYLPAFHRTEAWRTEYWIENNNLTDFDTTSSADIVVQVFDWQQNATVDPNYPDPAYNSNVPQSSKVKQVELYVPEMHDAAVIAATPESGDGLPSNPLQYRLHLQNTKGGGGAAAGLLAVRDELYGQTGRIPIPQSPAGFPYPTEDILDYSLYQLIHINFPYNPNQPREFNYELVIDDEDRFRNHAYETDIMAYFFMDYSGTRFQYEWDYDYDGLVFNVDGTGLPSPEFAISEKGVYHVGLRVRLNTVPPREYVYDIPIYVQGAGFDTAIGTGNFLDTTLLSNNQACAISGERYYIAYTSEESGTRQIWLAIGDNSGITTRCVTQDLPNISFDPSMVVVDDGSHDGIYILFNQWYVNMLGLYSIRGNLDGSGFDISNIAEVCDNPNSAAEDACLVYHDGWLFAYYHYYTTTSNPDIHVAASDNMGLSWSIHNQVNAYTGYSAYPAAVHNTQGGTDRFFVVWTDNRNSPARGSDLYIAQSQNGIDFTNETNISTFPDNTSEFYAAIASNGHQIGVAYIAMKPSPEPDRAYLKVIDAYNLSYYDYPIQASSPNDIHTRPTIGTACSGRFVIAYGSIDPISRNSEVEFVNVAMDRPISLWYDQLIFSSPTGNISPSAGGKGIYPGIASRSVGTDSATESLLVFTDFSAGENARTNPFPLYFGRVRAVQVITDHAEFVY